MKRNGSNVVSLRFGAPSAVSENALGDSVSEECARVLDFPASSRFRVRFDRIPPYDLQTPRFFGNLASSGIVTILTAAAGNVAEGAYLEVTEPVDGEVFRISLEDFVQYVHPIGHVEDPEEQEAFVLDAFDAFGLSVQYRPSDEFEEISTTVVDIDNLENFFPEAMPAVWGSESGFPGYAYFSGGSLRKDLEMEILPTNFVDPSRVTVLHLILHALDDVRSDGWEIPDDATLVLMKRPYVRAWAISVPVSLVRNIVLLSISRTFPLYVNIRDEDERIRRFFNSYVLPEVVRN